MAVEDGSVVGKATGIIRLDTTAITAAARVATQSGKAISAALREASREVQNQQRVTLAQVQQTTVVLRAQQQQISAVTRAESSKRIQEARSESIAKQQMARAESIAAIEAERRKTIAFRAEVRAREQAQRSSIMPSGGGGGGGSSFMGTAGRSFLGGMGGGVGAVVGAGVAAGVGMAAVQLAQAAAASSQVAAQNERTEQSFQRLTAGMNVSSEQMLTAMRKAADGLIKDQQLILNANRAMVMGVADNIQEMTQLLEVARARGQAVGLSTEEAFSRLTLGIGKREIEILDELGIVIKLIPAYEEYAKAVGKSVQQLTEAEKSQAIFNKVIADSQSLLDMSAGRLSNSADKYEKLGVSLANAGMELGDLINALGAADVAATFASYIDGLTESLREMADAARQVRAETQVGVGAGSNALTLPTNIAGTKAILSNARAQRERLLLPENQVGLSPSTVATNLADLDATIRAASNTLAQFNARLALATGRPAVSRGDGAEFGLGMPSVAAAVPRFDDAQRSAIRAWSDARTDLEEQTGKQVNDAVNQYNSQRASMIASYEKTIAREAEDWARQRADRARKLEEQIADVHADAARQRARWERDLAQSIARAQEASADRIADLQRSHEERVADAREASAERETEWEEDRDKAIEERRKDAAERMVDLENDFQRRRVQAQKDYDVARAEAAARGDGRALYFLERRFEDEQQEAERAHEERVAEEREALDEALAKIQEAHEERVRDEKEALDKSLRQAREAHDRQIAEEREALGESIAQHQAAHAQRLADAAEADAQRVEDMREAFAKEQAQAETERGLRLGRQAQDHQDQLTQLNTAHQQRLGQISSHAAEERDRLDEEFKKELEALGVQVDGWSAEIERATDKAITEFDRWLEHVRDELKKPLPPGGPGDTPSIPEFGMASRWMRGDFLPVSTPLAYPTPAAVMGGGSAGRGGFSISIGEISLNGITSNDPADFAARFETELVRVIRQATGAYSA